MKWRVLCLFEEGHCGHALLKVPIYFTELVAVIFAWKIFCWMHGSTCSHSIYYLWWIYFFQNIICCKTKYFFKNTSYSRLYFKVVSYCIWRGELRLVIHFINWVLLEDQVEPFILSCGVIFSMEQLQPSIPSRVIWNKVFKSGLSKFCTKQPLKNLKGYGLLNEITSLPKNILVFLKIYLVHSWILCLIWNS